MANHRQQMRRDLEDEVLRREHVAQERKTYTALVMGYMREDGRGFDAAAVRMREEAVRRMVAAGLDAGDLRSMEQSILDCETWFRQQVDKARELVALADGAP